jgi:hypothetical protein
VEFVEADPCDTVLEDAPLLVQLGQRPEPDAGVDSPVLRAQRPRRVAAHFVVLTNLVAVLDLEAAPVVGLLGHGPSFLALPGRHRASRPQLHARRRIGAERRHAHVSQFLHGLDRPEVSVPRLLVDAEAEARAVDVLAPNP